MTGIFQSSVALLDRLVVKGLKTHDSDVYTLQNNILVCINKNVTLPHLVYLPKSLVPFALAYFHYKNTLRCKENVIFIEIELFLARNAE